MGLGRSEDQVKFFEAKVKYCRSRRQCCGAGARLFFPGAECRSRRDYESPALQ